MQKAVPDPSEFTRKAVAPLAAAIWSWVSCPAGAGAAGICANRVAVAKSIAVRSRMGSLFMGGDVSGDRIASSTGGAILMFLSAYRAEAWLEFRIGK